MGRVRSLPAPDGGVRPADAVRICPATITVPDTRATYAAALEKLVADFLVRRRTRPAPPDSDPAARRRAGW
jgi:integrase/recombinase XerC/integrase/recombinase XerD